MKAFTLVELFIVIATIVSLVTLFNPVLGRARKLDQRPFYRLLSW